MLRNAPMSVAVVFCLLFGTSVVLAQRAGQSATVRTGAVTAMKSVDLNDDSANIRRASETAFEPASREVMRDPAIVEEMQEEASECAAAKQELVDADSDAAVDRAVRKVKLLCYD